MAHPPPPSLPAGRPTPGRPGDVVLRHGGWTWLSLCLILALLLPQWVDLRRLGLPPAHSAALTLATAGTDQTPGLDEICGHGPFAAALDMAGPGTPAGPGNPCPDHGHCLACGHIGGQLAALPSDLAGARIPRLVAGADHLGPRHDAPRLRDKPWRISRPRGPPILA